MRNTPVSGRAAAAREQARTPIGQFGVQVRAEADVALHDGPGTTPVEPAPTQPAVGALSDFAAIRRDIHVLRQSTMRAADTASAIKAVRGALTDDSILAYVAVWNGRLMAVDKDRNFLSASGKPIDPEGLQANESAFDWAIEKSGTDMSSIGAVAKGTSVFYGALAKAPFVRQDPPVEVNIADVDMVQPSVPGGPELDWEPDRPRHKAQLVSIADFEAKRPEHEKNLDALADLLNHQDDLEAHIADPSAHAAPKRYEAPSGVPRQNWW